MRFDMDNLNPAVRFYFDDAKPEEGWIDLRIVPAGVMDGLREEFIKKRVEYKMNQRSGRMERIEYPVSDDNGFMSGIWDYAIPSWLLLDASGKEIPYTAENKFKLMTGSKFFADFVERCQEILADDNKERSEESQKN